MLFRFRPGDQADTRNVTKAIKGPSEDNNCFPGGGAGKMTPGLDSLSIPGMVNLQLNVFSVMI